jgi:SAM-dependent methyltransferase
VSFGIDAVRYDALRPPYPAALVDRLMADRPRSVLDIACGTGIASRPFAERGCEVIGVEADERMAAVARANGIPVETAYFEDWKPRGRSFDLVICGQAWWWLELGVVLPKIGVVLRSGGRLGVFWNVGGREDELTAALRTVYDEISVEADRVGAEAASEPMLPSAYQPDPVRDLETSDLFRSVDAARYEWERRYTRDEWVAAAATFGDVIALPPEMRVRLLAAVGTTIDAHGGIRIVHVMTTLVTAVRT